MDMIGMIYPPSSEKHKFILVATDYFTKWVEAQAYEEVKQTHVMKFIKGIIYRFGNPQTITVDNGSIFEGKLVKAFASNHGISLIYTSTYYAQSNGQAKSTNKIIKKGIQRMVDKNPEIWHNLLLDTLWAYRNTKRTSTCTTPFALTYGHDAVLPMEIIVRSQRVTSQNDLETKAYH
ncbi:uncharacterized protein LOC131306827 [Rhododendron vialii]|uniref:uncharacterized protein LOC131306827 n=1 Tax=Rhododendron vialii TaxID=182163 RepID=UPI00265EC24E|nr:uncharacterized protein LOC131306827 [Rhododendron vialii]